jgi:hypothetical protein
MRTLSVAGILALTTLLPSPATTLQRLSVDNLVDKSTGIVRATAKPVTSFQRSGMIYTVYRLEVSETLKGSPVATIEVAVPGGNYQGLHQAVAGSPVVRPGIEYVVFYWTGPSGTNYIVGLGQGLFEVHTDASGEVVLKRRAMSSEVFGAQGGSELDHGLTLKWKEFHARVARRAEQ